MCPCWALTTTLICCIHTCREMPKSHMMLYASDLSTWEREWSRRIKNKDLRLQYTSWVAIPSDGFPQDSCGYEQHGVHSSHRSIIYAKVIFKLNALKFLAHFYVFTLWGGGRGGHLQLAAALMWSSEDNVQKQAFSFPHRGLRSWAGRQACLKGPYLLRSLSSLQVRCFDYAFLMLFH